MTLRTKIYTGIALLLAAWIFNPFSRQTANTDYQKAKATVMITNLAETSGGTGVVYNSSTTNSEIITNGHVCGVVKNGGIVKNDNIKGFVTSYYVSKLHDLCLIKTNANFNAESTIAKTPPAIYSQAAVSGHPHLLPTLITKGTFTNKLVVSVMTGFRQCEEADLQNPDTSLLCLLTGGIPVVKNYESQVVGATIQAGNSGSAVYNESGEVAGLVFAGSGDLSYGMIVPQEYLYSFIKDELPLAQFVQPNTTLGIEDLGLKNKLKSVCFRYRLGDENLAPIAKYCNLVNTDLIFNK